MKATAAQTVSFEAGNCCGARDYEYVTGGTVRDGETIEAWVLQRCIHCHTSFRMLAYCKQAGDEDATGRQFRHRSSGSKKFAIPSTAVRVLVQ